MSMLNGEEFAAFLINTQEHKVRCFHQVIAKILDLVQPRLSEDSQTTCTQRKYSGDDIHKMR